MIITNAFSLNMLASLNATVAVAEVTPYYVAEQLRADKVESAVGHSDTAALFGTVLGLVIPANRANVTLVAGDVIFVGQYSGPRLPEGATTLPEGATIRWCMVSIS